MIEEMGARKLAGDILGVSPENVLPVIVVSLEETLSILTPREKFVLDLRYGLTDGKRKTLEEVAPLIKVTSRERPRQIQEEALRRLRHPRHSQMLRQFIVGGPIEPETKGRGGKGALS